MRDLKKASEKSNRFEQSLPAEAVVGFALYDSPGLTSRPTEQLVVPLKSPEQIAPLFIDLTTSAEDECQPSPSDSPNLPLLSGAACREGRKRKLEAYASSGPQSSFDDSTTRSNDAFRGSQERVASSLLFDLPGGAAVLQSSPNLEILTPLLHATCPANSALEPDMQNGTEKDPPSDAVNFDGDYQQSPSSSRSYTARNGLRLGNEESMLKPSVPRNPEQTAYQHPVDLRSSCPPSNGDSPDSPAEPAALGSSEQGPSVCLDVTATFETIAPQQPASHAECPESSALEPHALEGLEQAPRQPPAKLLSIPVPSDPGAGHDGREPSSPELNSLEGPEQASRQPPSESPSIAVPSDAGVTSSEPAPTVSHNVVTSWEMEPLHLLLSTDDCQEEFAHAPDALGGLEQAPQQRPSDTQVLERPSDADGQEGSALGLDMNNSEESTLGLTVEANHDLSSQPRVSSPQGLPPPFNATGQADPALEVEHVAGPAQSLPSNFHAHGQENSIIESDKFDSPPQTPPALVDVTANFNEGLRQPSSDLQSLPSLSDADCRENFALNCTKVKHIEQPPQQPLSDLQSSPPIVFDEVGSATPKNTREERVCHHCGTRQTPGWRRTVDKRHFLCNACGLRWHKGNRPVSARGPRESDVTCSEPLQSTVAPLPVFMDLTATSDDEGSVPPAAVDHSGQEQLIDGSPSKFQKCQHPGYKDAEPFSEMIRPEDSSEPAVMLGEDAEGDSGTLPVREITSFRMCDANGRLVGRASLEEGVTCWMEGSVRPRSSEGAPLDCAPVVLKFEVEEWQPYHVETTHPETWIRSPAAWYILDKPAPEYESIYKSVHILDVLISHVIRATADSPQLKYGDFVQSTATALGLPHESVVQIIEQNIHEILFEVDNWFKKSSSRSELWNSLKKIKPLKACPKGLRPRFARSKATNEIVLKNRNISFVTPLVSTVAKKFFEVQGLEDSNLEDVDRRLEPVVVQPPRNECTQSIAWTSTYCATYRSGPGLPDKDYYEAAIVDDVSYNSGDFVYIRGEDTDEPWFGQICYFFQYDRPSEKHQAHVRWLTHGKNTMLAETASRAELMTIDLCDDVFLETFAGKPDIRILGPEEDEPKTDDGGFFIRFQYEEKTGTFTDMPAETNNSRDQFAGDEDHCVACQRKAKARAEQRCLWKTANGERFVEYGGVQYKKGDFVYLTSEPKQPYGIAQIEKFIDTPNHVIPMAAKQKRRQSSSESESDDEMLSSEVNDAYVRFRLFARCDEVLSPNAGPSSRADESDDEDVDEDLDHEMSAPCQDTRPRDDRRLFVTDLFGSVHPHRLEGLCWVEHAETITDLDIYRETDDSFYFSEKIERSMLASTATPVSQNYIIAREDRREERARAYADRQALLAQPKLVALDLFAGAGGLTCGFDGTGFIETKHAVEFSSSAGLTFKENFPNATVHIKCANTLLKRAVRIQERGEVLAPIRDEAGHIMPELPAKGNIDFISCGPSCQGFSHLNRLRLRVGDIKNTLIATSLSYVEFFRPRYFLLENVRGLTDFELGGVQVGDKMTGGIALGVVKLIVKTLHALNYQTRFGLLQAANHGLPQSRTRFFVWGAKRGLTLPELPQPTHCGRARGRLTLSLNAYNGSTIYDPRTSTSRNASLPGVTVWDAISDLPPWEYKDPDANRRKRTLHVPEGNGTMGLKQFEAAAKGYSGPDAHPYELAPLSNYQRLMRQGSSEVRNHYTRPLSENTVRLICNIPRMPGASALHLPAQLRDTVAVEQRQKSYGRVFDDQHHPVVLTELAPQGKHGRVLHPFQNRMLTVRELARIQGFPDRLIFKADTERNGRPKAQLMTRQIGNAVPPPLAGALGKKLMEAMLKDAHVDQAPPVLNTTIEPRGQEPAGEVHPLCVPETWQAACSHEPRSLPVVEISSRRAIGRFQRAPSPPPPPRPLPRLKRQPRKQPPSPMLLKRPHSIIEVVIEVRKRPKITKNQNDSLQ
ncbi:hypothetical protein HDU86_003350 [Geranomyces michiganensis]|nr:hypothetical protein HDU86_003350 [Geranomyces michiganensis]